MSTRASQPAENFDSTAKLMLEALAKASAELEKSVTAFTEQLISFNEGLQKSLDEELRAVSVRLEGNIKTNLDELAHDKHVMMKRLLEAERAELDSLANAGRQVRSSLNTHALAVEHRVEEFIDTQIRELKDFLEQPQQQISYAADTATEKLTQKKENVSRDVKTRHDEIKVRLSDKVHELERLVKEEATRAKVVIAGASAECQQRLTAQRESICSEIDKVENESIEAVDDRAKEGLEALVASQERETESLLSVGNKWREQIDQHCSAFDRLLGSLSAVMKENYETKLANVSEQARQEITELSEQAHEKIAATRSELEIEVRELEKEYIDQFENTLRKLEGIVSEHASDKRNGVARQHKSQKLRDQMQTHLKRWGADLVDSVKDAAHEFENDFMRATDGFHTRIEGARAAAVEHLERESRLMQKDLERTLKEFQKEVSDLENQINEVEKAGQDAALTVIACRKAVLSFRGE